MVSLIGSKAAETDAERDTPEVESKEEMRTTAEMEEEEDEEEDAEMRLSNDEDDDEDEPDDDDDEEEEEEDLANDDDEDHCRPKAADESSGLSRKRRHRRGRHQTEVVAANGGRLVPFVAPRQPSVASPECGDLDEADEEQLKRILAGKRLSEGNCNRHLANHLANICRKNSLHMIGESLPPVTEGEPMRHMSLHMSQNMESAGGGGGGSGSSHSNSTSSSSLRGGNVRHLASGNKRHSQDENIATSCSSSTSLDGSSAALRSPTRRRSSTVSQCSSVLSEGTRQQLNFDLSPDLAPDSSILEANAISPTDYDRPASPEPSSLDSMGDYDGSVSSYDVRPVSRLSDNWTQFNSDEPSLVTMSDGLERSACSPDADKGLLTRGQATDSSSHLLTSMRRTISGASPNGEKTTTTTKTSTNDDSEKVFRQQTEAAQALDGRKRCPTSCSEEANLERIITNVSEVKVSSDETERRKPFSHEPARQEPHLELGDHLISSAGTKRAHTPFGANIQRNKATHIEFKSN